MNKVVVFGILILILHTQTDEKNNKGEFVKNGQKDYTDNRGHSLLQTPLFRLQGR